MPIIRDSLITTCLGFLVGTLTWLAAPPALNWPLLSYLNLFLAANVFGWYLGNALGECAVLLGLATRR